jgi:hypothetical protein
MDIFDENEGFLQAGPAEANGDNPPAGTLAVIHGHIRKERLKFSTRPVGPVSGVGRF